MSAFRSSFTDPLWVDEVTVSGTGGRIGMTLCPGRSDNQSLRGIRWRRDLAVDLETIRDLGPCLLITLNELYEFSMLGVPDFASRLAASGLPWRHLPIPDGGVPGPEFEQAWKRVGHEAREGLRAGRLVVIHCRAGLGRTGMIAARLLVELGMGPEAAITAIRKARSPKAIEWNQEPHVLATRPMND